MRIIIFSILVFTCTTLLASDDKNADINGSIVIGEEYNSNLSIDELDLDSDQSGLLTNLELELDTQVSLSKNSQLNLAYMFSQSIHEEYSEFDLQSHGFSLGFDHTQGDLTYGFDYMLFDSKLDSSGFLQMSFVTPSVSYMLDDSSLVRFAYNVIDKSFDVFSDRDADSLGYDVSYYSFFDQAKSYFRWQLVVAEEDAKNDELDFDSFTAGFSVNKSVAIFADDTTVAFEAKYSERDYQQITQEILTLRAEQWAQVKIGLNIPIYQDVVLNFAIEHNDRSSNLASADYTESRAILDFIYEF